MGTRLGENQNIGKMIGTCVDTSHPRTASCLVSECAKGTGASSLLACFSTFQVLLARFASSVPHGHFGFNWPICATFEMCCFMTMWEGGFQREAPMERVIRDSVCSHAEDWMATIGSVRIKAEVERLTNVRPQQDTSITALKDEVEGMSPMFGTAFASLADSFTTLSKASEVHDKFRAVATARLKYLEEDFGMFVRSGDVWEDRVNRLEDQAGQVEAQVWQLVEQAGQLEELHREMMRLSVASEKCAASLENLHRGVLGVVQSMPTSDTGNVGDLQTLQDRVRVRRYNFPCTVCQGVGSLIPFTECVTMQVAVIGQRQNLGLIQLVLFAMQMHDTSVSAIIDLPFTP